MKIDLGGKTALVTGSTAGIGLAIAKGLAGAGVRIVVNGRHHDSVERGVAAVLAAVPGGDVIGAAADVSGGTSAVRLMRLAIEPGQPPWAWAARGVV